MQALLAPLHSSAVQPQHGNLACIRHISKAMRTGAFLTLVSSAGPSLFDDCSMAELLAVFVSAAT